MKKILTICGIVTAICIGCGTAEEQQEIESNEALAITATTGFAKSSDGLPISYTVKSAGEINLVFVHGQAQSKEDWDGVADPYLKKYGVVTLDLGGHGESGTERDLWTVEALGQDIVAVVTKLDLNNVILVGFSPAWLQQGYCLSELLGSLELTP